MEKNGKNEIPKTLPKMEKMKKNGKNGNSNK